VSHESPALASPPETARALTDALHAAADRARDERVRLARALRLAGRPVPDSHCPADDPAPPAPPQPPTPAAVNAAKLAQHLQQLDAVIRDRLKTLNQTQARIDEGERRLVTLERAIQQATQRFTEHLQQASRLVETQTTTTSSPAASPPGPLPDPAALAQRLDELARLDKSIDQRVARLQQMHKQAGEIVERVLTHAVGEVEDKAAELAAPIQAEVERLLAQQTKRAEAELARRIAALEEQSRTHLQRQMSRLRDEAIRLTASAEPPDTAGTIHVPGPEALKPPMHALAQRIKPERDTPSQGAA
jgi:DNA repair exonuclease SbcCD ATPase subunit